MADDRARTTTAWAALQEDEEDSALAGIPAFLAELRRLGRKHIPAGWKYLQQKPWTLLAPAEQTAAAHNGPYETNSDIGRALMVLARIGHTSLAKTGDGRLIYLRQITPQVLALAKGAALPTEVYAFGTRNFFAWREFLASHLTNVGRFTEILSPWPWPPKADGSVYSGSDPPPFVDGTLATDEDLKEMAKG